MAGRLLLVLASRMEHLFWGKEGLSTDSSESTDELYFQTRLLH